jgi:hypothetical protein
MIFDENGNGIQPPTGPVIEPSVVLGASPTVISTGVVGWYAGTRGIRDILTVIFPLLPVLRLPGHLLFLQRKIVLHLLPVLQSPRKPTSRSSHFVILSQSTLPRYSQGVIAITNTLDNTPRLHVPHFRHPKLLHHHTRPNISADIQSSIDHSLHY